MKGLRIVVLTSLLGLSGGLVLAQPGPGMGHGGRWGADITPGWALMTPQERDAHRDRMRAMTSYDDCKAYRDEHHAQMVERAKQQGGQLPAQPRRDPCAGLKK